jgi:hypothetical protein
MAFFLFRKGDGNEGNFVRFIVELSDKDCPYRALEAMLANEYIAGKRVRRLIIQNVQVDGEPEYGLSACVHEGPEGEQAFGAAWLTAELQPLNAQDLEYERNQWSRPVYPLREVLDNAALRQYRAAMRKAA